MQKELYSNLFIVLPNLHWRYTGVTATNRMVAPRVARLVNLGWLGSDRPDGVAQLKFRDLFRIRSYSRQTGKTCIWHARRNNEMIVGLALRLLGWRFKLLFTSAAQRSHTWITRFLVARMDAVIATSEAAASYIDRKTSIIHHGIELETYCPPDDRAKLFEEAALPGKHLIGIFGRVRSQKGTDVFIEAMCQILPKYPDFSAVVIGQATGNQQAFYEDLQNRVNTAGLADRIRFLGYVPIAEVPLWYKRVTISVFASLNEGFGLTILEAMAAGTALVAARSGAAEVLVDDGDTGVLVPPGDVAALVRALEPLMGNPERAIEMGRRARARAVVDFGIDTEVKKIVAVYGQMSGQAAGSLGDTSSFRPASL